MAFDIFTGAEVNDGESSLKRMCLNCTYCKENSDGSFACRNEAVLEKGREKIMSSIPEEYKVAPIQIEEMALKNPTKKCGNYLVDLDLLTNVLERVLGDAPETLPKSESE